MNKPLRIHDNLKPLSRDHHQGLLLCWKIREGLRKDISPERIKEYAAFFYETQLIAHFKFEEAEIFPILGNNNQFVKQALSQHQRLVSLFTENLKAKGALKEIEKALEDHIRFEERVLFQEIQMQADEKTLSQIEIKERNTDTPDPDDWDDQFWKS